MLSEHGGCERVNLNLPANLKPRALKAEIKPANTREEAPYRQFVHCWATTDA